MAESEKLGTKRILVTGGDGLVGSAIRHIAAVEEFREDEEWVFTTAREADLTYYFFLCDHVVNIVYLLIFISQTLQLLCKVWLLS